jgi:N-acyl-D-aspartate/D-glutamate deacylase
MNLNNLGKMFAGFAVVFASSTAIAQGASTKNVDMIIENGFVLDGTGAPWIKADVAITGDRIKAIGSLQDMSAKRRIDATGLYVSPGFIDPHTHAGEGLIQSDLAGAEPLLVQGLTTVMINPDGGSVQKVDSVDIAGQREVLLDHGVGLNVIQLVPHGMVRRAVMGEVDKHANPEQLDKMRALVRKGMQDGAFGMSSGLFYVPGSFAEISELVELGKVVGEYGGLYTSHIRDESDYSIGLIPSVDEVIKVAREAKIPGIVTHVKALGPRVWGFSEAIVQRIEQARAQGVEMWVDQYPYDASSTSLAAALIPRWAMAGGTPKMLENFKDAKLLKKMRPEIEDNLARRGGADQIQLTTFGPDTSLEGQKLSEIADKRGKHAIDATIELLNEANGKINIVSFNMLDSDIESFMNKPWRMTSSDGSLVAMGKGVPHPRAYGAFPRMIAKYSRDDKVVPLATAIHSMTGLPATVHRMKDRGFLFANMYADIAIFDLKEVKDTATFDKPHQLAKGMRYVFVNGQLAIDDGKYNDKRNGRVLNRNGEDFARK